MEKINGSLNGIEKTVLLSKNKINFKKFKIIEIVQSMFSHHNGITLENKNRNIFRKSPQYLEIKKHTSK